MRSPPMTALALLALLVSASGTWACSGDPGDEPGFEIEEEPENQTNQTNQNNGEEVPTLQLQGQLAPAGGLAISDGFTLSGELQPSFESTVSASESFRLEVAAPIKTAPVSVDDSADD